MRAHILFLQPFLHGQHEAHLVYSAWEITHMWIRKIKWDRDDVAIEVLIFRSFETFSTKPASDLLFRIIMSKVYRAATVFNMKSLRRLS